MLFNHLGALLIAVCLCLAFYNGVVCWLAVRKNNGNLVRSAQYGAALHGVFIWIAGCLLWRALLNDDFSVQFVWGHSSADLPLFYKITALWGGMEGSLLFWEMILALFTVVIAWNRGSVDKEVQAYAILVMNFIHVFLLFLLITYSNPFSLQFPIPAQGRGLNPLLQHPAMALHPPMLYLGYVGFSAPFAYAVASLLKGRLDNGWLLHTRRWSLGAWWALAVGQMLGGQWAYEELGWGGYWGWDPVENAALLPWLTGTAFLHSIVLQEKRGMMKVWNVSLIILTFSLSILGTFIVRSGVLNSVHAFAQSDIGPAFLGFLFVVLILSFGLMFWRIQNLQSRYTADYLLSRESMFLLNNLLLMGIAFTVLLGTIFPLLAEALKGARLSIQAPFFNTLTVPMGVALLFLIGVGTLIPWRKTSWESMRRIFGLPCVAALITVVILLGFGVQHWGALLIYGVCAFTTWAIGLDFWKTVRVQKNQQGIGRITASFQVVAKNRQHWGGALAHLGLMFLFVGLSGNLFQQEWRFTLKPGQTQHAGPWELKLRGVREEQQANARLRYADLALYQGGKFKADLRPARSFYPTQPEPLTEVAIHRNIIRDIYVVLAAENRDGSITFRMLHTPLVMAAWLAFPFFTLGAGLALLHRPRSLQHITAAKALSLGSTPHSSKAST